MAFLGFLKLAVICFNVLAWPLLALVYPLWVSIGAIEADNSSECRKLVAYWVLFSLIFLFEQAFHNLLLWLPFWLYMKLLITWWLVMPDFDGAFYAYKNLVCPCLSIDVRALIDKVIAQIDSSLKRGNFEDELERFVKEKGPQALVELIASKLKGWEAESVQKDVKAVQVTEQIKKETASNEVEFVPFSPQKTSLTGSDITQSESEKPETNLMYTEPVEAVGEFSETNLPKHVQKDWTCAICQVTTDSEPIFYSHLLDKRHKNACEELKANTQQSKTKPSVIPGIKLQEWKKVISQKNNPEAEVNGSRHEAHDEPISSVLKGWETKSVEKDVITVHETDKMKKEAASDEMESVPLSPQTVSLTGPDITQTGKEKPETVLMSTAKVEAVGQFSETIHPKHVQKDWTCDICQIRTDTEAVLLSHLQGKRHKTACEELKAKSKPLVTPGIKLQEWKEVIPQKNNPGAKVRENRHEAHVGHISSEMKCREPNTEQNSLETTQLTKREEVQEAAVAKQQVSPSETYENNLVVEEIKEISGEAQNPGKETRGNLVSNQVQNEWACDLCQVKCHCEIVFNSHLQGKRHKAACEKLKAGFKELKTACEEVISICDEIKTNTQQAKSEADSTPKLRDDGNCSTTSSTKSIREPRATVMQLEEYVESKFVEKGDGLTWLCKICNVNCSSKISLNEHLNAKKHLAKLRQLECCQA